MKPKSSVAIPEPGRLPLMETFYTLQGEGFHQGKAAFFIRLAGCDVGCVWCDIKESWDGFGFPQVLITDIVQRAKEHPCRLAVVTGGEPTLYDLTELTDALHDNGFQINLETSGAHPLRGNFDWVCLSPKKFKPPVESALKSAHELKVVIFNKSDFKWAESFADRVSDECMLFLQPEWSKAAEMTPLIINYIAKNPQWQLSLQIHKYVNIP